MNKNKIFIVFILSFLVLASGCSGTGKKNEDTDEQNGKLKVVATTSIVFDIVAQVGGDWIDLDLLLPIGTDPHGFTPTPQEIAMISDADVIFANGGGLETFLDALIESAGAQDKIDYVSQGIDFIEFDEHDEHGEDHDEDEEHAENEAEHAEEHAEEEGHAHEGVDPHTWIDPNNVIIWVSNIESHLAELDAANADEYGKNAAAYQAELRELDTWIREQAADIPEANRKIVTDHVLFNYFCEEYGFTQEGAIIPGYSTASEPSARELAELEDVIAELNIQAVFVGKTINPALAERLAEDTGIDLYYVYTGSLSDADGEAGTYLEYMRYNVSTITSALK